MGVLPVRAFAQVVILVIEAISIFVVHLFTRESPRDNAMHEDRARTPVLASLIPDGIPSANLGVVLRSPRML
jgi:hypothetical protein